MRNEHYFRIQRRFLGLKSAKNFIEMRILKFSSFGWLEKTYKTPQVDDVQGGFSKQMLSRIFDFWMFSGVKKVKESKSELNFLQPIIRNRTFGPKKAKKVGISDFL